MQYAEYFTLVFTQWIQFLPLLNDLKRTLVDSKAVVSDNGIDYDTGFIE